MPAFQLLSGANDTRDLWLGRHTMGGSASAEKRVRNKVINCIWSDRHSSAPPVSIEMQNSTPKMHLCYSINFENQWNWIINCTILIFKFCHVQFTFEINISPSAAEGKEESSTSNRSGPAAQKHQTKANANESLGSVFARRAARPIKQWTRWWIP